MKIIETGISDLLVLEPSLFKDNRGYFFESYNCQKFESLGLNYRFVQDNESFSDYGTLRGLHLQKGDAAQAKLVRVIQGEVLDVAVDVRHKSPTFGKVFSIRLSAENKKMLMIPRGFAHGFVVLSETAVFAYKCDNFYNASAEGGIIYNDPTLNIDWGVKPEDMKLSPKDLVHKRFKETDWSQI
nr:dTDP-4-dehydrorhamnose 3,5-epimerase [Bacteriovorax sp. HI3]